jgi:DNA-binding transcriptional regulator YiaG
MEAMPNIASILKSEISRIARKELRAETQALKKAVTSHRAEIAALKRRVQTLEREHKQLGRARATTTIDSGKAPDQKLRFSAKGLASQRKRLGLSAHDCGLLVGTTGQSIYLWESGSTRPRNKYLPAIASLRTMGRREATVRLAALKQAQSA